MNNDSKIYIAGHTGMVGSAIVRNLRNKGYSNIIGKTIDELDLINQLAVKTFFELEKPEYVILAAAKVGGIVANNTYRAEFIYENLQIQNNIIHQSYLSGVKKLLFLGSSCIYPKEAPQPMKEEYLLTGLLEYTNEPYAIAKIAGIKMCESYYKQYGCNYISVMPTNLYGPNDNYDLEKSHVLPALIRKMHLGKCLENNDWNVIRKDLNKRPIEGISGQNSESEILFILSKYGVVLNSSNEERVCEEHSDEAASSMEKVLSRDSSKTKTSEEKGSARHEVPKKPQPVIVTLWGTGHVYREFLHVNDMADACVHLMEKVEATKLYDDLKQTHINIGTGIDLTIRELAETVMKIVGFNGELDWDTTKPDGTPKKQLDVGLLNKLDWKASVLLQKGIESVYRNYLNM